RVWYITGTSSGLGRTLLEEVLANGERAVGTCRNTSAITDLATKYPDQLLVQSVDVTNAQQIKDSFAAALARWNRVDVVVNNAGYALFGEIESITEEEAKHNFEVQFWGVVRVMKEAVRIFREVNPPGEGGRIFNVSTIGGYRANPTLSYYSASKFALEGFTQSFLQEMSPEWNIKGCVVQPGGFASEWRFSSAKITTPHPAYTNDNNACHMFRTVVRANIPYIGNLKKMGKTIVKLADLSANGTELPLRVQLGSDSSFLVGQQAKNTLRDLEAWKEFSKETDEDGMD
ncbi:NAD(P)-binding protein, partial [Dendrothele bispora CBS 962.96]